MQKVTLVGRVNRQARKRIKLDLKRREYFKELSKGSLVQTPFSDLKREIATYANK